MLYTLFAHHLQLLFKYKEYSCHVNVNESGFKKEARYNMQILSTVEDGYVCFIVDSEKKVFFPDESIYVCVLLSANLNFVSIDVCDLSYLLYPIENTRA